MAAHLVDTNGLQAQCARLPDRELWKVVEAGVGNAHEIALADAEMGGDWPAVVNSLEAVTAALRVIEARGRLAAAGDGNGSSKGSRRNH